MKKYDISKVLILVIFIVLIASPLLCIRWSGDSYSESEKRLLAPKPTMFLTDGTLNPKIGVEFKNWLEDHIGLREVFININAAIKLKVFHQSPSDKVHIGKNGWYYYTQDENLQIATGEYTLTENTLQQILENHLVIKRKLAEKGIEYVIILPTSKVSIYPENLRYGNGELRETPVDLVADYLEKNSDLKIVRLKEVLLEAKKSQQVFFKTDTHWTQMGAYAAYKEIIHRLEEWELCTTKPVEVRFEDAQYTGEFGAMLGTRLPPETIKNTVLLQQSAVKNNISETYEQFCEILKSEGIYTPCYYYENSAVQGLSVMMYGDSMFGGWNATELLAENFSDFFYIWDGNIRSSLVDAMSPDIVIYELTERYLNAFPLKNTTFLQTQLEDYQAEIQSFQWDDLKLEVIVKNNSNSEWKYMDQIKLGIFSEGHDTGLRLLLPMGKHVRPGESVTLIFSFEDYVQLLSTNLEVQMLQEGICYFGSKTKVIESIKPELDAAIISHTAPTVVNHRDKYTFNITVANTGTNVWSEEEQIKLCIWQDSIDWGYRLTLPENVTVDPGEQFTFTLEGFVLPEADQTFLEFQMLQEGVTYFGERVRTDILAEER